MFSKAARRTCEAMILVASVMPESSQLNSLVACGLRPLRSRKCRSTVLMFGNSRMAVVRARVTLLALPANEMAGRETQRDGAAIKTDRGCGRRRSYSGWEFAKLLRPVLRTQPRPR